jgi:hypothetical protein
MTGADAMGVARCRCGEMPALQDLAVALPEVHTTGEKKGRPEAAFRWIERGAVSASSN